MMVPRTTVSRRTNASGRKHDVACSRTMVIFYCYDGVLGLYGHSEAENRIIQVGAGGFKNKAFVV